MGSASPSGTSAPARRRAAAMRSETFMDQGVNVRTCPHSRTCPATAPACSYTVKGQARSAAASAASNPIGPAPRTAIRGGWSMLPPDRPGRAERTRRHQSMPRSLDSAPCRRSRSAAGCTPTPTRCGDAGRSAGRRGCERLFCLGDLGGFGAECDAIWPLLREHGVECIAGNYDVAIGRGDPDCGCGYTDPRDNHFAQLMYDYTPRAHERGVRRLDARRCPASCARRSAASTCTWSTARRSR